MRAARVVSACLLTVALVAAGGTPALGSPRGTAGDSAVPAQVSAGNPPSPAVPRPARTTQQPKATPPSGVTPHRVSELADKRSESIKRYRMSDGSIEAELFAGPVHYRDKAGHWQDIDTRIGASDKPGYGFGNTKSAFRSDFGRRSDQLVGFEVDGRSIAMGAAGTGRPLTSAVAAARSPIPTSSAAPTSGTGWARSR
jgi:hypothetical protein